MDDIDHLSNREYVTVGEQLAAQFGVGLARMARTIRERMNVRDNEVFTPIDLINAKTLSSVINSFFGTNQLSQFMDQTNPLAEITHKRRLSALGPGGLLRVNAPVSRCATCTIRITDASALSKRLKDRTSDLYRPCASMPRWTTWASYRLLTTK